MVNRHHAVRSVDLGVGKKSEDRWVRGATKGTKRGSVTYSETNFCHFFNKSLAFIAKNR